MAPADDDARKRQLDQRITRNGLGALAIVLLLFAGIVYSQWRPGPRSESKSYRTGFTVGRATGLEDARRRQPVMGTQTARAFAQRLEVPSDLDSTEYREGWRHGYAAGYESYAK